MKRSENPTHLKAVLRYQRSHRTERLCVSCGQPAVVKLLIQGTTLVYSKVLRHCWEHNLAGKRYREQVKRYGS